MVDGLVGALLLSWILNWFGFGDMCVKGISELFNLNITIATYYLIAALIGLVYGAAKL